MDTRSVFKPELNREGNPAIKLIKMMRTFGYNSGGNIVIATVVQEPPNLAIRVEGDSVDVPEQGIVCNPDLLAHTLTVKIDGITRTIEYPNRLTVGAQVYAFEPEHGQLLYVLTMA